MVEESTTNVESTVPDQGQTGNQPGDPASSTAGQSSSTSTEAPSNELPENLRGKSQAEIAQMYASLEKKLGEHSGDLGTLRKYKEEMDQVLRVIWADPDLYRTVERKLKGDGSLADNVDPGKKGGGEAGDKGKTDSNDDLRKAAVGDILSNFEKDYKITALPEDQKVKLNKKIASEFAELRDPGGNKSVTELINTTPAHQLRKLLDKAYWLAVKDNVTEGNSSIQDLASIGSMSASSSKSDTSFGLTESELKTARNLGVSPEKYAKRKKESGR